MIKPFHRYQEPGEEPSWPILPITTPNYVQEPILPDFKLCGFLNVRFYCMQSRQRNGQTRLLMTSHHAVRQRSYGGLMVWKHDTEIFA